MLEKVDEGDLYTISSVEIKRKKIRKSRFDGLLLHDSSSHWSSLCEKFFLLCLKSKFELYAFHLLLRWEVSELSVMTACCKWDQIGNRKGTICFTTVAWCDQFDEKMFSWKIALKKQIWDFTHKNKTSSKFIIFHASLYIQTKTALQYQNI